MPDNWGICWLEQLLNCLTNCVGWEDILARDCRVGVGTEEGGADPNTELIAAVCWDTCPCDREELERVDTKDRTLSAMVTKFWQ